MVWSQVYDPLSSAWLSTIIAASPVIVLLGTLGVFRMKAHTAANKMRTPVQAERRS